jgi:hypothetical protein
VADASGMSEQDVDELLEGELRATTSEDASKA